MDLNREIKGRMAALSAEGRSVAALRMSRLTWTNLIDNSSDAETAALSAAVFGLSFNGATVRLVENMVGIEIDLVPES